MSWISICLDFPHLRTYQQPSHHSQSYPTIALLVFLLLFSLTFIFITTHTAFDSSVLVTCPNHLILFSLILSAIDIIHQYLLLNIRYSFYVLLSLHSSIKTFSFLQHSYSVLFSCQPLNTPNHITWLVSPQPYKAYLLTSLELSLSHKTPDASFCSLNVLASSFKLIL